MEESDTSSEEEEDEVDGTAPQSVLTAAKAAEAQDIKQVSEPLTRMLFQLLQVKEKLIAFFRLFS